MTVSRRALAAVAPLSLLLLAGCSSGAAEADRVPLVDGSGAPSSSTPASTPPATQPPATQTPTPTVSPATPTAAPAQSTVTPTHTAAKPTASGAPVPAGTSSIAGFGGLGAPWTLQGPVPARYAVNGVAQTTLLYVAPKADLAAACTALFAARTEPVRPTAVADCADPASSSSLVSDKWPLMFTVTAGAGQHVVFSTQPESFSEADNCTSEGSGTSTDGSISVSGGVSCAGGTVAVDVPEGSVAVEVRGPAG